MNDIDRSVEGYVDALEVRYSRATRLGLRAIDRGFRLINLTLMVIGVITILRWIMF